MGRSVFKKYPPLRGKSQSGPGNEFVLHQLASTNDIMKLKKHVRLSSVIALDINLQDDDFGGRTALHIACQRGYFECSQLLLENGADPTLRSYDGWTPAHCAAEIGNIKILKLLLQYSGTVVTKDDAGATPKHIADVYGHKECSRFLKA